MSVRYRLIEIFNVVHQSLRELLFDLCFQIIYCVLLFWIS